MDVEHQITILSEFKIRCHKSKTADIGQFIMRNNNYKKSSKKKNNNGKNGYRKIYNSLLVFFLPYLNKF